MNSPRAQRALNSSRRIKYYSRPFTSPGRGARVVYETDKWSCRSFWSRALTSVDLPAPAGATMMNTLPAMLPALMAHDRRGDRVENAHRDPQAGDLPKWVARPAEKDQSILQSIGPRSEREDSMHNTASAKRHRENH